MKNEKSFSSPLGEEKLTVLQVLLRPLVWAAGWIVLMGGTYRGMRLVLLRWARAKQEKRVNEK